MGSKRGRFHHYAQVGDRRIDLPDAVASALHALRWAARERAVWADSEVEWLAAIDAVGAALLAERDAERVSA